jgi:hypothetical protein
MTTHPEHNFAKQFTHHFVQVRKFINKWAKPATQEQLVRFNDSLRQSATNIFEPSHRRTTLEGRIPPVLDAWFS